MKNFVILICLLISVSLTACNGSFNNHSNNESSSSNDTNIIGDSNTEEPYSENPITDFTYEFTENQEYALITRYIGTSKNVVIPSEIDGRTVTSLKGFEVDGLIEGVFANTDIETVVIPDTVMVIGNRTFKNCSALSSITIQPNSQLHTIGAEAFENCSFLKNVDLENAENLKTIGAKAFYNCTSIENIKLQKNLETIGVDAFSNCSSLKSVNVPTKLNLMNSDRPRFSNVPSLEKIIFDEGWQNIQGYMFFATTSTVNITIPRSVTSIGALTFANMGTLNIHFFGDCPQLLDADKFDGNAKIYYDTDTVGWDSCLWKN